LAFYEDKTTEIGDFFLSCRELGLRLGVAHKTASIYLQELVECKIIKVISIGRMINGRASEYHWMLMP
jgi:DNA-binding transcriptional regulator YhcF (GntR family)